jgi:DNA-binding winged helix-turn-helix (wHTH) protein
MTFGFGGSDMSDRNGSVIYEFGSFRADPLKRWLSREGEPLPLTAKAFETLLVLLRQPGVTISKNELIDTVWADIAVEENNLTQQISTLRKALGERPGEHKFIVTVPGRGYCFIAPVREIVDPGETELELREFTSTSITIDLSGDPQRRRYSRLLKYYGFRPAIALVGIVTLLVAGVFWFYLRRAVSNRPPQTIAVLPFRSPEWKRRLSGGGYDRYTDGKAWELAGA